MAQQQGHHNKNMNTKKHSFITKITEFTRLIPQRRKRLVIASSILLFVILPVVFITLKNARSSIAAWWDETWSYRQRVDLTNSAGSTTNQYVKVTLDTATLITAGKMQSDCDDVRVTNQNGILLTHFIDGDSAYGRNDSDTSIYVLVD